MTCPPYVAVNGHRNSNDTNCSVTFQVNDDTGLVVTQDITDAIKSVLSGYTGMSTVSATESSVTQTGG